MPTISMTAMLINKVKEHWVAVVVFLGANVANFWQMYFKGLIPFPSDLLVSFFFPWNSGGFFGFNPWTIHKEYLAADAVRQMFVWKSLGFHLWNPYNFSGSYLLANLQSSFFSLSTLLGWVPTVVVIMSLFGFFTYLFLKDLRLSTPAAIIGGLAASNLSYLTGWQEILVNCQSALFLPLILLFINHKKYFMVSLLLALSIFGGHVQTAAYVYFVVVLYGLFKRVPILTFSFYILFSFCLAAIQLIPTIEAYLLSARETPANVNLLMRTTLPWQGLITYFVSDFFGNTATNNLQPIIFNYADARAYMGVVPAIFSLFSIFTFKNRDVKFFLFLAIVGLLLATWPGGLVFIFLKIPILSSVVPARMIMVFLFAASCLAAYGFENLSHKKVLIFPILVFFSLWIFALVNKDLVARSNLIIPSITFLLLCSLFFVQKKLPKIFIIGVFVLGIFEPAYYFSKHQPFADKNFVFPMHPVFRFLQNKAGYDRFYGFGSAYIDNNFATYYHVFSAEGYDPLYIKRYGELMYSANVDGQFKPKEVPRSDAKFVEKDNYFRNRLFDLMGVKYILDKEDKLADEWEPDKGKFSPENYDLAWHANKWSAFARKSALPRVFLAGNFIVEKDPQKILDKIYDKNFDLRNTLILEENVTGSDPVIEASGSAEIIEYKTDNLTIKTNSLQNQLLFLSDSYYPGWRAFIDGQETKIYRADYAFRSVVVPSGSHTVKFLYDPMSFKIGLLVSAVSLFGGLCLWLKKYFHI